MLVPNRHGSSADYRYGFNGKELDNELKGEGNSYDFGARMLDSRLGRWFARDPKESKYPYVSPYSYAFNNPIYYLDPDGRDVLPTPSFLRSRYGSIYNDLIGNSSTFQRIILPYQNNKRMDLIFDINHAKATMSGTAFASTSSPNKIWSTYSNGPNKGKVIAGSLRLVTNTTENYSNDLLTDKGQDMVNKDGIIVAQRTFTYSDIFIAAAIIHESVHALVAYNQRNLTEAPGDASHTQLNGHRDLMVKALTEYVTSNCLNYSTQDIDDMSWHGTEKSKQFSDHFEEIAKVNGTTKDNEINIWKERKGKLSYKFEEWKQCEETKNKKESTTSDEKSK
jgi:RHS repeat-associated protein